MPWWGWVLVWVVLFAFAGIFFTVLGLDLWRSAKALFREAGEAGDRLTVLTDKVQELSRNAQEIKEPAVFESPSQLRQERFRTRQGSESRSQRLR